MPDQIPASNSEARKRAAEHSNGLMDPVVVDAARGRRLAEQRARIAELEAERDAALAALARVEALADKWAGTPGAYGDHGSCLSAAWREADRELRAALTPATKETPDE